MADVQQTVSYITDGKRPFPDFIKNHKVFQGRGRIDKVFPSIGLPNFRQECDITNTVEARQEATALVTELLSTIQRGQGRVRALLDPLLRQTERTAAESERCSRMQAWLNATATLTYQMTYQYGQTPCLALVEGRVVLRVPADIYNGEKNPLFRRDEGLLRAVGKLREQSIEMGCDFPEIDKLASFKSFSRTNVPSKKNLICFSATGEEGAYDIATISMRGIASCQAWGTPQSKGLVGSVSSKYVGVLYIASDQEIKPYGSKMVNRSMVRFAIHSRTKKPALIIDRMYPSENADTVAAFKKVLADRTGMDVLYTNHDNGWNQYYIPDEPSNRLLAQEELSYMDSRMNITKHVSIETEKPRLVDPDLLVRGFRTRVKTELTEVVRARRALYEAAREKIEAEKTAYEATKAAWEAEHANDETLEQSKFEAKRPKMEDELTAFGGGGVRNLFRHCDKQYGEGTAAGKFADLILSAVNVEASHDCETHADYHRRYLMSFLRNARAIRATGWTACQHGSWMKAFPGSAERFYGFIFSQMRAFFLAEIRTLIANKQAA